ncbi:MAG: hypothetical protein ACRDIZ_11945 [Actinomycetota bacterium]
MPARKAVAQVHSQVRARSSPRVIHGRSLRSIALGIGSLRARLLHSR